MIKDSFSGEGVPNYSEFAFERSSEQWTLKVHVKIMIINWNWILIELKVSSSGTTHNF